jgi:hypothetical protein
MDVGGPLEVVDEFTQDGTRLQILSDHNACVIKTGSTSLALRPKAPCFFLRRDGKIQSYDYKDAAVDWIVIVAGTTVTDAHRKTWNLGAQDVCGEQTSAVVRRAGRVRVLTGVHSNGAYCKDRGVDETEFRSLAHDPE